MAFITVMDDNEPFPWSPTINGEKSQTVFRLQQIPEDQVKVLRKKHTKTLFENGERVTEVDPFKFTEDVLDAAIVGWEGVFIARTDDPLPVTRANKMRLPERIKAEVVRLCAGKEAGLLFTRDVAVAQAQEEAASKKS